MQWNHALSPVNKKLKTQASTGKFVLTIVWDVNSSTFVHFEERGQNVTSARYNDMPVNELMTAIRSKRRELISKRVFLPYENDGTHTAAHTVDRLF